MKALSKKEYLDLKKPTDGESSNTPVSNATDAPSVDFSTSIESPFVSREESISKIESFLETYFEVQKRCTNFEILQDYNKTLAFSFTDTELSEIYNKFIEDLKTKPSPTLSFQELMSQEFPKARFTLEPFFEQGTVNMISAPPNTWKSWLLFLMSSHIASGTELFGRFPTEKSKVMIVNEEDSFRAIQDRFKILGVTDTTLPIYFRVANGSKLESKFVDSLLKELKEKEIGVVIFDSLRSMHEADENDSTAMQKILDQMKRLSRESITVIFTHHHRKKSMFKNENNGAESSRGSSAINAAISGHVSLDEEDRDLGLYLVIRHLKSKAGEKLPAFDVKIVKEIDGSRVEFVYDGSFKETEKKIKQAKEQIMEILNDNKWKTKKDFESIKCGDSTMRQSLQSLKNDGMILSITRKQAIAKKIPVTEGSKGKAGELYYSLNTESAEAVTMIDNIQAEQEYLDFDDNK